MSHALGDWRPVTVAELRALLAAQAAPWWIAGGWALELFAGKSWRAHEDVEAGVLRADFARVSRALARFESHAARSGTLTRLAPGEPAPDDANSVWFGEGASGPWRFELLLDSRDGSDWVFRRDTRVRVPLAELVSHTADGCPYLLPEIQLLYKAKQLRPKDETDFAAVAPLLDARASDWLRGALERASPGHPWLARLRR